MEKVTGIEYTLDIKAEGVATFAMFVLRLVNMKSSRSETIADIKTLEDMDRIVLIAYNDMGEFFEEFEYVEVKDAYPIEIITQADFSMDTVKELDKLIDEDKEFYFDNLEY